MNVQSHREAQETVELGEALQCAQKLAHHKAAFFRALTYRYRAELRLLFRGGKLWSVNAEKHLRKTKEEQANPLFLLPESTQDWNNVVAHSLVEVAAAHELCDMLGIPEKVAKTICHSVVAHDWKKRWERAKVSPPPCIQALLAQTQASKELLDATNPDYLEQVFLGRENISPEQKLAFYCDIMMKGSEIVPTEERIKEVEEAQRSKEEKMQEKAGGRYWQYTRRLRDEIEQEYWQRLRERKYPIKKSEDIPLFIRTRIEDKTA